MKNGDYGVIKEFNMVKERNGDRVYVTSDGDVYSNLICISGPMRIVRSEH